VVTSQKKALKGRQARKACRDPRGLLDLRVRRGSPGRKASLGMRDRLGKKATLVRQDHKDLAAIKVSRALRGFRRRSQTALLVRF
jgi:hypothetical protein